MKVITFIFLILGLSACSAESPKTEPKIRPRPEVRLTDNLQPYARNIRTGHELRKKLGGSSVDYGNGQYRSMRERTIEREKRRQAELKRLGIKK